MKNATARLAETIIVKNSHQETTFCMMETVAPAAVSNHQAINTKSQVAHVLNEVEVLAIEDSVGIISQNEDLYGMSLSLLRLAALDLVLLVEFSTLLNRLQNTWVGLRKILKL
ncbi:hypothetical protein ACH5RR_033688 [Cinchona calisaya]|uniref:Uncharacterized protein n=1 Tax=Cinchona calisaya TaxID=153742 RepID=A0ABD2Y8R1_9GENT